MKKYFIIFIMQSALVATVIESLEDRKAHLDRFYNILSSAVKKSVEEQVVEKVTELKSDVEVMSSKLAEAKETREEKGAELLGPMVGAEPLENKPLPESLRLTPEDLPPPPTLFLVAPGVSASPPPPPPLPPVVPYQQRQSTLLSREIQSAEQKPVESALVVAVPTGVSAPPPPPPPPPHMSPPSRTSVPMPPPPPPTVPVAPAPLRSAGRKTDPKLEKHAGPPSSADIGAQLGGLKKTALIKTLSPEWGKLKPNERKVIRSIPEEQQRLYLEEFKKELDDDGVPTMSQDSVKKALLNPPTDMKEHAKLLFFRAIYEKEEEVEEPGDKPGGDLPERSTDEKPISHVVVKTELTPEQKEKQQKAMERFKQQQTKAAKGGGDLHQQIQQKQQLKKVVVEEKPKKEENLAELKKRVEAYRKKAEEESESEPARSAEEEAEWE